MAASSLASWQGAWSPTRRYPVGAIVMVAASYYVCVTKHLNQPPPHSTYWRPMLVPPADAYDVGTVTVATTQTRYHHTRLAAGASRRVTLAGTGRLVIADDDAHAPLILGAPKAPRSFTVPNDYAHTVPRRLSLTHPARATLAGTATLIVSS